jgi:hypothetical protein
MEQNLTSETDSHSDDPISMQKLKYVVVFRSNLYFFNQPLVPGGIHE